MVAWGGSSVLHLRRPGRKPVLRSSTKVLSILVLSWNMPLLQLRFFLLAWLVKMVRKIRDQWLQTKSPKWLYYSPAELKYVKNRKFNNRAPESPGYLLFSAVNTFVANLNAYCQTVIRIIICIKTLNILQDSWERWIRHILGFQENGLNSLVYTAHINKPLEERSQIV